jgi:predicted O-methyltransferase YrrM
MVTDNLREIRQLAAEVEGWLSNAEGEILYLLAKQVPSGQAIVELGSWKGKSTIWLAKGAQSGQGNKVYSIDPHHGSETHVSEGEEDTYGEFLNNLAKAGVKEIVVPIVGASHQVAKWWQRKVGLLWIDASHRYEDVKRDFLSWKSHLASAGIVAFHDCNQPGPAGVVNKYVGRSDDWIIWGEVDSMKVARKCR